MFYVTKTLWLIASPDNLAMLLLLLGVLLLLRDKRRLGGFFVGLVALVFAAVWLLPVAEWTTRPLEDRFPVLVEPPAHVDGVLVLGGATDLFTSVERGRPLLNGAAERVLTAMRLAEKYPQARIVYSGGSGTPFFSKKKEAAVVRELFAQMEVPDDNVFFETQARTTLENIVLSRKMTLPQPHERWLLVTSAYHMPRAMGVVNKVGWEGEVVPYCVDYRSAGKANWNPFDAFFARRLRLFSVAVREWAGLAYYYLTAKTDMWFPGPAAASS